MKSQSFSISCAALWVLASCTGTDVGNPAEEPSFDVDVALYNESIAPMSTARLAHAANGSIDIDDGWVSILEVRLGSGPGCGEEIELEIGDGAAVDLFAPGSPEALSDFVVEDSGFCGFTVRLDGYPGALPDGAPEELPGSAIVLRGTRGDGTPFVLSSDQDEEIALAASGGAFSITDGTNALVLGLDAALLFAGLDLDGASIDADNIIRISPTSNKPLLDAFQSNLDDAAELYDDDDGNGELDSEERDDDDSLAD